VLLHHQRVACGADRVYLLLGKCCRWMSLIDILDSGASILDSDHDGHQHRPCSRSRHGPSSGRSSPTVICWTFPADIIYFEIKMCTCWSDDEIMKSGCLSPLPGSTK